MSDQPLSRSRPKRKSAAATAEKIQASLKEESKRVTEEAIAAEAPAPKKAKSEGKKPAPKVKAEKKAAPKKSAGKATAPIDLDAEFLDRDDDLDAEPTAEEVEHARQQELFRQVQKKMGKAPAPSKSAGKAPAAAAAAAPAAPSADDDVLLGHFVSRMVGMQYHGGNGVRYNKELLHLRRDPHNRFDPNAIALRTIPGGAMVGHMQRLDALAVARVADDASMKVTLIAQIESNPHAAYKIPLRVSFFGKAADASRVAAHLAYCEMSRNINGRAQMGGGITLIEPKRRGPGSRGGRGGGRGRGRGRGSGAASSSSAAPPLEHEAAAAAAAADDDDEVEFSHERTWEEKDAELRKHAIVLD